MKDAKILLDDLFSGNNAFVQGEGKALEKHQATQTPFMTVVMCSDSRVSSRFCNLDTTNNFFLIRNIGNQVSTAPGSVDYGVLHLHTPLLMILGHSGCGAVKASLSDYSSETNGIKAELDSLQGPVKDTESETDQTKRNNLCIQKNVDNQVEDCMVKYKDLVESGKLTIIGALFDFHNLMGEELGKFHVLNINGKKDKESVKALDLFDMEHFRRF